jgi:hypothetical protein
MEPAAFEQTWEIGLGRDRSPNFENAAFISDGTVRASAVCLRTRYGRARKTYARWKTGRILMKRDIGFMIMAAAMLWGADSALWAQDAAVPPAPATDADGSQASADAADVEVLTRGPVHEAFAQHYDSSPQPGPVVTKAPPEPINEIPPDFEPEGNNVQWIPGYWSWDAERQDFVWISGLWRDVPPNQRWVPGSWSQVDGGFQWISGFWTSQDVQEITYLPAPPQSQENGPNVPAPNDNSIWIPGQWTFVQSDYQWQPGYWTPAQQNWVWVPSRYYWTPYGYVYTAGYWDYPPTARGVLFSPIYAANYYSNRVYQPQVVVPIGPMLISLFVRPGYRSYYFGNYYGNNYQAMGFYPWISAPNYITSGYYYDPLWMYYRFSAQPGIFNRLYGWNQFYFNNPGLRPANTFAQSQAALNAGNVSAENRLALRQSLLGEKLSQVRSDPQRAGAFQRFSPLSENQRQRLSGEIKQFRELQQARGRQERQAAFRANQPGASPTERNGLKLPAVSKEQAGKAPDRRGSGKLPQTPEVKVPAVEERLQGLPSQNPDLNDQTRQELEQKRQQLEDRVMRPRRPEADQDRTRSNSPQTPEGTNRPRPEGNRGPDQNNRIPGSMPNTSPGQTPQANPIQPPRQPDNPSRQGMSRPGDRQPGTQPLNQRNQTPDRSQGPDRSPPENPLGRFDRTPPAKPFDGGRTPMTAPQGRSGQVPGGGASPLGNPLQQETRRPIAPLENPGTRTSPRTDRLPQPANQPSQPLHFDNPGRSRSRPELPRPNLDRVKPAAPSQASPAAPHAKPPAASGRGRSQGSKKD